MYTKKTLFNVHILIVKKGNDNLLKVLAKPYLSLWIIQENCTMTIIQRPESKTHF